MIRLVAFLSGLMALDPRTQRALEAAFADWRHELKIASTRTRALIVNIRSAIGVVRTLATAGSTEIRSASMYSFVWRLGVLVALWTVWMLKDGPPGATYRFFLVTSQVEASALVAASLIPKFLIVFPLMVFLAEALGRRQRVTPIAGTSMLLAVLVLFFGLVLLPSSLAYSRYESWKYFANASVPEPDATLLLSGLTVLSAIATVFSIAAMWVLFIFANRVRRVGGVTGWGIGLGVVILAALAGPGLPLVSNRVAWVILRLTGPFLTFAALLWATNCLARIDAARSTNSDGLPSNGGAL